MDQDPLQTAESTLGSARTRRKPTRRVAGRTSARPVTAKPILSSNGKLRLVGAAAPDVKPPSQNPTPITSATDPRWVLAVATAQLMEGDVLTPTKRESLMSQGKSMGLSPFDCSLILAIIQDRARRGVPLDECASVSESQLALIPPPGMRSFRSVLGDHPKRTVLIAGGLLALQALLIWSWLG